MDLLPLDKNIASFIKSQTAFTIATCIENKPYCATCFYSFIEETFLVFKSSRETQHIREALQNKFVAGAIVSDKFQIGKIKGIQFNGIFVAPTTDLLNKVKKSYYTKYPFAAPMTGELWVIDLTYIKYTDNTLGFGKKTEWKKPIQLAKNL